MNQDRSTDEQLDSGNQHFSAGPRIMEEVTGRGR